MLLTDGANARGPRPLDEPTLQDVADLTGGEYSGAENADQLMEGFLSLPSQILLQKQDARPSTGCQP